MDAAPPQTQVRCRLRDDGSFLVPVDVLAHTAAAGSFLLIGQNQVGRDLAGRRVRVQGFSRILENYVKN